MTTKTPSRRPAVAEGTGGAEDSGRAGLAQGLQASRSAAQVDADTSRRGQLGPFIVLLLLFAAILVAARITLLRWHPEERLNPGGWVDIAREHSGWAFTAAAVLLSLVFLLLIRLIVARLRRRRALRPLAAAAKELRVPVGYLMLRRARWQRGHLVSGRLEYPRGAVTADHGPAVAKALEPFTDGPVTATWQMRKDRLVITPRIKPNRLEDRQPAVKELFETMSHLIPGFAVDQKATTISEDGGISRLEASYGRTTRDIGDGFRERISAVLEMKAPSPTGYWTMSWEPSQHRVVVTPAAPLPLIAPFPLTSPAERLSLPIGLGAGGKVIEWLPLVYPHMIAVGRSGSGKTIFLNGVVEAACARGWRVFIGDPKEVSFSGYAPDTLRDLGLPGWPGVEMVATTDRELERVIEKVYDVMRDRYAALKTFQVAVEDLQPVLFVVDEASELVERLNQYHASDDKYRDLVEQAEAAGLHADSVPKPKGSKNPVLTMLWSILRLGREAAVIVLLAQQRPDASYLPGEAKLNVNCRVSIGHLDPISLGMVFGTRSVRQRVHDVSTDPATGRTVRRAVKGRATADLGEGPQTIQSFWVPNPGKALGIKGAESKMPADDRKLVADQHAWVTQHHARWSDTAVEVAPAAAVTGMSWEKSVTPTVQATAANDVSAAADPDSETLPGIDVTGLQTVPARELAQDDEAVVEIDREHMLIRVTEVIEDPDGGVPRPADDDDGDLGFDTGGDLLVSYEVLEGSASGQLGVIALDAGEAIHVS